MAGKSAVWVENLRLESPEAVADWLSHLSKLHFGQNVWVEICPKF
jgi:hypothetical protein